MREMKESGIAWVGQIPETWSVLRNKYNFDLDKTLIGSKWNKTQLLSLTKNGVREIEDGEQTGKVPSSLATYQEVNECDLVMCLFDLDCSAVFSGVSKYKGMISPAYKCFKCKAHINHKYADYYFKTVFVDRKYKRYSKNVRFSITSDEFFGLPITVPPFEEQVRIGDFLDAKCAEIDSLISDIQTEIDTLEQYKRSVITEAVIKGLNPNAEMKDSGIEWIGNIPKHWDLSKIDALYSLRNTKVSDKDYMPLSVTMKGILPQLDSAAKTNAHDDRKLVKRGDFAINSRSDRRGSCGISPYDGSVSLINTVLAPKGAMNSQYYNWLFHTVQFADEFYKWGHGIVDDLWTTGWQDMKKISIPVPLIDEQARIADFLNERCKEIDEVVETKKEQLSTIEEYKKSMIYEYVTGKKQVPTC